jgi:hypothetical protein
VTFFEQAACQTKVNLTQIFKEKGNQFGKNL